MTLTDEQKTAIDRAIKFARDRGDNMPDTFAHVVTVTGIPEDTVYEYLYSKSKQPGELF